MRTHISDDLLRGKSVQKQLQQQSWSLFVPIKIAAWQAVAVLTRDLSRGDIVQNSDLTLREIQLPNTPQHYFSNLGDAVGQQATHHLRTGDALQTRQLQQPKWIRRGDEVMIIASSKGVSAKMMGTAMSDGKKHQQIQVRNQQSQRIIKAKVIGPGKVETVMWPSIDVCDNWQLATRFNRA